MAGLAREEAGFVHRFGNSIRQLVTSFAHSPSAACHS